MNFFSFSALVFVGLALVAEVYPLKAIDLDSTGLSDIYEDLVLGGPSSPTANVDLDEFNA